MIEFVRTVQNGSFSSAALELGITGSAIGKTISKLEARLGTKLLHRTTRRITLTNEGQDYYEACLRIIEELDEVEQRLALGLNDPVGRVRLELPGAFGRKHVLPVLSELVLKHQRLELTVMFTERTADLISESVDLAIRIGHLEDESDLVATRLGTQKLVICAAPSYIEREGTPARYEELASRPCIVGWRRSASPSWLLKNGDTVFSAPVSARHQLSDGAAMVSATLAGWGLSQLPTWLVGKHLESGELVEVLSDFRGAEMPIHALWPKTPFPRPKVRFVIDAMKKAAATSDAWRDIIAT
ncbi:DNA-binding transcriptional LysR family regulator [Rhizobium sp. SLBN-94]|nr:DNA-binding transcriptional LysR family regulator [Rhizobium sp. SLBN-94]